MEPIRRDRWPLGINNVVRPSRLPEGAVRDLVNLDPSADGILSLRAGYSKVLECTNARAAFAVGDYLVVVDGTEVKSFHPQTQSIETLGLIADAPVSAVTHAGVLYLNTAVDSLRTDGTTLKPWAINPPGFTFNVVPGGTLEGRYRLAVTATGDDGEESGADSMLLEVPAGSAIQISSDDPRPMRLYASVTNGASLFYQKLVFGGGVMLSSVRDDTEVLTTDGLVPLPHCDELVSHHAVVVGRRGRYVFFTSPMYPHLTDPISGFFQFPSPVRLLAATDGGVYIVADKTYFVTGLETSAPSQRVVLETDAVEGTAVKLPDGRVAWFTRYGQVLGSPDGQAQLVHRQTFAPDVAQGGAAGVLNHNGNEMVVTTMRGVTGRNNLATGDFADLEIDDGQ
uniref:Putative structural protein n=1 Tax=viral metagenome TaxID=1070528 RepID=A0A6M3X4W8_9ZZZZ